MGLISHQEKAVALNGAVHPPSGGVQTLTAHIQVDGADAHAIADLLGISAAHRSCSGGAGGLGAVEGTGNVPGAAGGCELSLNVTRPGL